MTRRCLQRRRTATSAIFASADFQACAHRFASVAIAGTLFVTCPCARVWSPPGLLARRITLKGREFMSALHPIDALGDLNVGSRRNQVGIVIGGTLDVDDSRQDFRVRVEEART